MAFGALSWHARAMSPESRASRVVRPALWKELEERHVGHAERLRHRNALRVHGRSDVSDRWCEALLVEQKAPVGMLDPAGIHDHAGWMEHRVHVGKRGFNHARQLADVGKQRLDQLKHLVGVLPRQRAEPELLDVAVDADGRRPFHPRHIGQRHRLAGLDRPFVSGFAQLVQEVQPAARVPGIEKDRLSAVEQRRERACIGLVRHRGHDQHDQIGTGDGLLHIGRRVRDRHVALDNTARLDAAARAQMLQAVSVARLQPHLVSRGLSDRPQPQSRRAQRRGLRLISPPWQGSRI